MTDFDTAHSLKYSFDDIPTRPALALKESSRPDSPTTSKVCGTPYLPEHAPYPYYDGRPMFFIAQFNFSELEQLPGFPTTGLLQLFVPDSDSWGDSWMVPDQQDPRQEPTPFARYFKDLSAPHVGKMPEEEILDSGVHPAPKPLIPVTIDGVRFDQEVNYSAHEYGRAIFDPTDPHTLLRRGRDYVDIHLSEAGIVSRWVIGGKTTFEQPSLDDQRSMKDAFFAAVASAEQQGFTVDPHADEYLEPIGTGHINGSSLGGYEIFWNESPLEPADPRITLATIDQDGPCEWGDAGVGNFYIHPDDLAARDFDRVEFSWDCG
ncbi:YwqG family protein [Corynebacterium tuberculostearicum]|uniref:YwqG family protein n=1 Tax=Corynebacterium tuberculostearicum TaxID=38304 RepID=UPI002934F90F|nr:YwqG family protein [Corynebacterium tuberculostearicum]MDV2422030.1 YwqG family protein [Corynebacterium tuberculostearicum]